MPWANHIESNEGEEIILCACDTIAYALYRGTRYNHDYGRRVVCNRWLCDQCHQNILEMDDGKLRLVRHQRVSDEAYTYWENWYPENAT